MLAKFENALYETVEPKFDVGQYKPLLLLGWFTPSLILIDASLILVLLTASQRQDF
jgi:hypothetical protein